MNRIPHYPDNTQRANFWQSKILAICSAALFLLLTGCGGSSGSNESNADEDQNLSDTTITQDYLFFLDQRAGRLSGDPYECYGDCDFSDSPPDEFDIYRVASAAGHALNKLNSVTVRHLFRSFEVEEIAEGDYRLITGMVWLENGQIFSAKSDHPTVITIASQNTNQTFCSIDYQYTYDQTDRNVLKEAGADRSCSNDEDNISYLFELVENSPLTPANSDNNDNNDIEPIGGYAFWQLDESGTPTVYTFRYLEEEQKTIVTNTETREVVAEYAFEIPFHNLFQKNGWLFVLEEERLLRISLSELKNGTFDLDSSYIPLSDYIGYNSRVIDNSEYNFYGSQESDLINTLPNEPVLVVGLNDIRSLNLISGQLSEPVTFTASFYYPYLNFLETPGLAYVRHNDGHYFVDVNTGQADLAFEAPPSGYSTWSHHGDLVLLSNEDSRGAGRGAYVLSRSGLDHSYPDATWGYSYSNELDYERYVLLLTATSASNGHEASIQIIDKNDFSVVRNLGSYTSPYHNISIGFQMGYEPGRYQIVTDTYNSNVFFVDLLTENSLTYLMTANGEISL